MIFSPYSSPIILVSEDITIIPKFEGGHPERGRWMSVGWVRIGDFRPISRRISETVRDTTKVTILITNRKSNTWFRLVPKSTTLVDPEMTLDLVDHCLIMFVQWIVHVDKRAFVCCAWWVAHSGYVITPRRWKSRTRSWKLPTTYSSEKADIWALPTRSWPRLSEDYSRESPI